MNDTIEFVQPTDEEVSVVRGWLKVQKFWREHGQPAHVGQRLSDEETRRVVEDEPAPVAEHKLFTR